MIFIMIAILVLTIEWVWDGRCGRTLYKGLVTLVKFMAHIYIYIKLLLPERPKTFVHPNFMAEF